MVLLGGLEVVAAGYILHKHNQNKRERDRLREAEELIEEQEEALRLQDPNRRHRRRSDSRDRKSSHRHRRDHSAPADRYSHKPRREQSAPPVPQQTQAQVYPGVVAGWPAHWEQSQKPQQNNGPPFAHPQPPPQYTPSNTYLQPPYAPARGRSAEDLRGDRYGPSRSPSPRVRFDDGTRPGDSRSPPPKYEGRRR